MNLPPGFKSSSPVHWLAFGLGSGLAPKAPGTAGTVAALPLYLLIAHLPVLVYAAVVLIALLAGVWLCGRTAADLGVHDHGGIVWDEFVGLWIALFMVPLGWFWIVMGFVLFRLFDILKPWPIRWVDKRMGGGWGIMLDDVLAGIMAALCIQAILVLIS